MSRTNHSKNNRTDKPTPQPSVGGDKRNQRARPSSGPTTGEGRPAVRAPLLGEDEWASMTRVALGLLHPLQAVLEARGWTLAPRFERRRDAHGRVTHPDAVWNYSPAFGGVELDDKDRLGPRKPYCRMDFEDTSGDRYRIRTAGIWGGCGQHCTVDHAVPLTAAGFATLPGVLDEVEGHGRGLDLASFRDCSTDGPCAGPFR